MAKLRSDRAGCRMSAVLTAAVLVTVAFGVIAPTTAARGAPEAAPFEPAGPLFAAAAPLLGDEVEVTGKVLYDSGKKHTRAATVDVRTVFSNNAAYMHMKAKGLRETESRGKPLFSAAKASTDKALRDAAQQAKVQVITVPGGVSGGDKPVADLTRKVIDRLPIYHVDGKVEFGRQQGASNIAQIDTQAVLEAIPEYREAKRLGEDDARFHLLRKKYMDELTRVVQLSARRGGHDAVVELGGVTSRLGPVPNVTATAIAAVDS